MTDREDKELAKIEEFCDADAKVSEWVDVYFNHEDGVGEISKSDLKTYFEGCTAKELSAEARKKLAFSHYGQKQRSRVVKEIWEEKYDEFKKWVKDKYIPEAEASGQKLYHLKGKPESKSEGMVSFFADMTAFAFADEGDYTFENFDLVTSARIASYEGHQKGNWKKEDYQIPISGYNNGVPFAPASFPPDFPEKALNFIRSWSSIH